MRKEVSVDKAVKQMLIGKPDIPSLNDSGRWGFASR